MLLQSWRPNAISNHDACHKEVGKKGGSVRAFGRPDLSSSTIKAVAGCDGLYTTMHFQCTCV